MRALCQLCYLSRQPRHCHIIWPLLFAGIQERERRREARGAGAGKMLQSLAGSSCVRLVERHRSAWCFGFLVLGYLLYLVFGAVVFSSVELPYEDLLRQELRKLKRRFLEEHECLSEPQLEQFLGRVLEASNYGVSVLSNASGNWNWDFTSALFFASTVLSTTGRGHAATLPCPRRPQASPGRILRWPAVAAGEVTSEHYVGFAAVNSSGVGP